MNRSICSILALLPCLSVCAVAGNHSAAKAVPVHPSDADLTDFPVQKTNDPWQRLNRTTFRFNDEITTYALRPVAHGYAAIVPLRVRTGLTNFFDNLNYPVRFINCVLQGKITRSEWRETLPNSAVVLRVRPMPGDTLMAGIRGEMHCGPGYCAVRVGGQNRRREIRRTPISALELLCLPYSVQWAHLS